MTRMKFYKGLALLGAVAGSVALAFAMLAFWGGGASGSVLAQADSSDGSSLPGVSVRAAEDYYYEFEDFPGPDGVLPGVDLLVQPTSDVSLDVTYTVTDFAGNEGGPLVVSVPVGSDWVRIPVSLEDDDAIDDLVQRKTVTLSQPAVGAGYRLSGDTEARVVVREGICDRTPQVEEAILARLGSTFCYAVDETDLSGIDGTLDLSEQGIVELKSRDFEGLFGLEILDLSFNSLTSLPPGVFVGLTLDGLLLEGNGSDLLQIVPDVREVDEVAVGSSILVEVGEGFPAPLNCTVSVNLGDLGDHVTLPASIGAGETRSEKLTVLDRSNQPVHGYYKAHAECSSGNSTGVAFVKGPSFVPPSLPVVSLVGGTYGADEDTLVNGESRGNDILIPLNISEPQSDALTVRYLVRLDNASPWDFLLSDNLVIAGDGLKGWVVVLPGRDSYHITLPLNPDTVVDAIVEHFTVVLDQPDYTLRYRTNEIRTEVSGWINDGLCDRTPVVRDLLLEAVGHSGDCYAVTAADLDVMDDRLSVRPQVVTGYKKRDFGDLTKLYSLSLYKLDDSSLSADVFSEPHNFDGFLLSDVSFHILKSEWFSGLEQVRLLHLNHGMVGTIGPLLLSNLPDLELLRLTQVGLSSVPGDLLQRLDMEADNPLTELSLHGNQLTELPPDLFAGVKMLSTLELHDNMGSPFQYTAALESLGMPDASPFAEGFHVVVRLGTLSGAVAAHTPFEVTAHLTVEGGELRVKDSDPPGVAVTNLDVSVIPGMSTSEEVKVLRSPGHTGPVLVTVSGLSWNVPLNGIVNGVVFVASPQVIVEALEALVPPSVLTGDGGERSVALSWDSDPGASGYEVQQRASGNLDWTTLSGDLSVEAVGGDRVGVLVGGLQDGVSYEHRVRCLFGNPDGSGNYQHASGWSNPVTTTTSSAS